MTTKKDNKHTHRGTCQVCGRAQAVANGVNVLAKHGYTVTWGYFNGVCRGAHNQPLELDKTMTEATIKHLREEYAPAADQRAADLRSGAIEPDFYNTSYDRIKCKNVRTSCTRAELQFHATYETQDDVAKRQITAAVMNAENDARHARSHAEMLVKMIEARHGKALIAVEAKRVLSVGDRVNRYGKIVEVVEIKNTVARGCGPYMNGRVMLHAFLKYSEDKIVAVPVRSIRTSTIVDD
jgi:hypothetical protein